ncbi:MAG: hypothetical protein OXC92_07995 [Flavobacteriaceae bacterium]|nr:hypothetical protein [Flavobacteriaceae bacterium]MCY4216905.1 hypothetical protein [Flavobacteriaceae bacterium]MCY4253568.1 hypothetical protein [Flavobacteriaceae bacterium]
MKETQGWAHHVVNYGYAAKKVVQQSNGQLTEKGFDRMMKHGKELRYEYYQGRLKNFLHSECELLINFLKKNPDIIGYKDDSIV